MNPDDRNAHPSGTAAPGDAGPAGQRTGAGGNAEDRPPFLGSWRNIYTAVLLYLAGLILLFYLFTRVFS